MKEPIIESLSALSGLFIVILFTAISVGIGIIMLITTAIIATIAAIVSIVVWLFEELKNKIKGNV